MRWKFFGEAQKMVSQPRGVDNPQAPQNIGVSDLDHIEFGPYPHLQFALGMH